ncbi:hypothetical protein M408DRAFT_180844 [Serendipita vermifera MAFF 305830]|uniref:Amidohydrolase 3 domain-containing protein n=1 Tax=Serendipita vermifera MAFF 305830 TaxID=933852 RepID=A0A0C3B4W4_SERVB|nr:hypothetical protein M408DRAFT_180844 [Serendipita vermifera MAFF 305830]
MSEHGGEKEVASNMSSHEPVSKNKSSRTIRTRNRVTKDLIISRLGTFLLALLAASVVLLTKRYDLESLIGSAIGQKWTGDTLSNSQDSQGTPMREYAVCTRHKSGIYTVEESSVSSEETSETRTTQCLVVGIDGIILSTGSIDSIKESHPSIRPTFLPKHAIVVPGLVDSHTHIMEYGWSRALNLDGATGVQDVISRVREYVLKKEAEGMRFDDTTWIEGVGWDQNKWPGWTGGFPTYKDIEADPVLRGKPIILFRIDLHAVWVSKRVLELCGKLPETVDGGEIIVDTDGKATGVFLDNAQLLIPRPDWSVAQMREFYQRTMQDVLSLGLTAVHEASTIEPMIKVYKMIAEEGGLPVRMHLMAHKPIGYLGDDIERFDHFGKHKRLHLRSVKLITDGAIGSWGAAMYEPYSDNPSTSGFMLISTETLRHDIHKYLEGGWQVNTHCIGDRSNGILLDIFEDALRGRDVQVLRPRIEHAQIFRPDDLKRVGELGLIASVQPKHATSDMVYANARLGDRVKTSYAYRSLIESGARIALGSDMPVESANPLVTFHAAVTRVNATGQSPQGPGGWYPDQKLTRHQALKGMSIHLLPN